MARYRRPDRTAQMLRLALTRRSPALTGGSISPLLSDTTVTCDAQPRPVELGGTNEIQSLQP